MKPIHVFWFIVGVGVVALLVAFFVIRSSNEQKLTQPRPRIIEETKETQTVKKDEESHKQEPTVLVELEPDPIDADAQEPQIISGEVLIEDNTDAAQLILTTKKVTHYHNEAIGYGMIVPYGVYYSGFGPQEGSIHSIGFHNTGIPEGFSDAQVQVLYYGNRDFEQLSDANFFQDPNTNDTYIRILDNHHIRIHADSLDNPILLSILESIYVGPSLKDKLEQEGVDQ